MEKTIRLSGDQRTHVLFGPRDKHLRLLRDALGVRVASREADVHLAGDPEAVRRASLVLRELDQMAADGRGVSEREVRQVIETVGRSGHGPAELRIEVLMAGRTIRPQTRGQMAYCRAILDSDLTFCIGPAGTGKTYLAVAMAVQTLKRQEAKRLVLVRPAVEAGERLGFLPGDLQAKVNPYLRPLLDALHDMMGFKALNAYMNSDVVEIIPLAYMRGRTLNDAVILLDEAQNTTTAQMKMFLTRMGLRSRMVVTGDITQVDLEPGVQSGLVDAIEKLQGIDGIALHEMTRGDIVRHRLVQTIVNAYERGERGDEHRSLAKRSRRPAPPEGA